MRVTLDRGPHWDGWGGDRPILLFHGPNGGVVESRQVRFSDFESDLEAAERTIWEAGFRIVGDWETDEYGCPVAEVELRPYRVYAWWDDQDPENSGWVAEVYDIDGDVMDCSLSVGFPVDVDQFAETDWRRLWDALEGAFPDAEVEVDLHKVAGWLAR